MRYLTECRYIAVTATVCLKEIGGRKEAKNDSFDSADQIHQKTKHIFRSHTLRIIPWGNSTAYKKNREGQWAGSFPLRGLPSLVVVMQLTLQKGFFISPLSRRELLLK